MIEYKLTYCQSANCRNEDKLPIYMEKQLQRAAKRKKKGKCTIDNDEIQINGVTREKIARKDIIEIKKNSSEKIIIIAKKGKKNKIRICTLKFKDEDEFKRFSNDLNGGKSENKTPANIASSRSVSPAAKTSSSPESLSPDSYTSPSTINEKNPNRSQSASPYNIQSRPRQHQPQASPSAPMNSPASTYVTTDFLTTHNHSRSAKQAGKRVSEKDVYPIKKAPMKERPRNEFNYLTYIPGKGVVKSGEKNGYQYNSRIRDDSASSSFSSSYSTSTHTTDDFRGNDMHRIVPSKSSNRAPFRRRSSSQSSSSSSSSSVENRQRAKSNDWRSHKRR
ncbi:hypothetical protein Aperf_G00000032019 [Anoplocephala perfoliata]